MELPAANISLSRPTSGGLAELVNRLLDYRHWSWRILFLWSMVLLLAGELTVASVVAGLRVRRWAWDQTTSIRFTDDITNAYKWGRESNRVGYLQLYPREKFNIVINQYGEQSGFGQLDYPPLRLLIMDRWAAWTSKTFPDQPYWQPSYEFNRPLLTVNTAFEMASAVGAFLLVTLWVARGTQPVPAPAEPIAVAWFRRYVLRRPVAPGVLVPAVPPARLRVPIRAWVSGAIAAALMWFNVAVIWDAHVWPQWDVWVVPFFLFAALFASLEWWLAAGAMIAVGALLKGQMMLVAPLFLLWPLFSGAPRWILPCVLGIIGAAAAQILLPNILVGSTLNLASTLFLLLGKALVIALAILVILTGRWGAALRWAIGFGIVFLGFVSPWLVQKPGVAQWAISTSAVRWVISAALAVAMLYPWPIWRRVAGYWRIVPGVIAAALLAGPFVSVDRSVGAILLIVVAVAGVVAMTIRWPGLLPARWGGYWIAGALVASLYLCVPLFGGDTAWYQVGYDYGTRRYQILHMNLTFNLASILTFHYDWPTWGGPQSVVMTVDHPERFAWLGIGREVNYKDLMTTVYFATLAMCAAGAALHGRRRDPRILIALAAPWILFYALLPQMHERYLVFAAGITAIAIGAGIGMGLLHLLIVLLAWVPMIPRGGWGLLPNSLVYLQGSYLGGGWMVTMVAAVFLYIAVAPRGRRQALKSI